MKYLVTRFVIPTVFILCFTNHTVFAQMWQQTATKPEGGGITQLLVADNGDLFATTASNNYPSGDMGGIRRSTDTGNTWENLMDTYNGRFITQGNDGLLYASVWPYPSEEGLYRSSDNGESWEQLMTVPSGNNIFSITVNATTTPPTIFAGTRFGIMRSTDGGNSFSNSSSGIDPGSWVMCMDVDIDGIIGIGTTTGYYISLDNGASWTKGGGDLGNDTITALKFFNDPASSGKTMDDRYLYAGVKMEGDVAFANALYQENSYLFAVLGTILTTGEISDFFGVFLLDLNKKLKGAGVYPSGASGGGYYQSTDDGENFEPMNEGLPDNPKVSSIAVDNNSKQAFRVYAGLFEATNGGAGIYYLDQDLVGIPDLGNRPPELKISATPNPFSNEVNFQIWLENSNSAYILRIFASDGTQVFHQVNSLVKSGSHFIYWQPLQLESGVYYYSFETGGHIKTGKLIKQ